MSIKNEDKIKMVVRAIQQETLDLGSMLLGL